MNHEKKIILTLAMVAVTATGVQSETLLAGSKCYSQSIEDNFAATGTWAEQTSTADAQVKLVVLTLQEARDVANTHIMPTRAWAIDFAESHGLVAFEIKGINACFMTSPVNIRHNLFEREDTAKVANGLTPPPPRPVVTTTPEPVPVPQYTFSDDGTLILGTVEVKQPPVITVSQSAAEMHAASLAGAARVKAQNEAAHKKKDGE
jgi:hypothetical protein